MKINRSTNKTIAVKGAYPGAGATHLCLCLSNYMASKEKQKVIYIELGENSALTNMVRGEVVDLDGILGYKYMGVIYVLNASIEICHHLLMTRSENIVIDVRTSIAECMQVINLCSKVVIIGSFKPWNEERFGKFIQMNTIDCLDKHKVTFFSVETNRTEKTNFQNIFHRELHSMPIILNPLCIRQKEFVLLNQLLSE